MTRVGIISGTIPVHEDIFFKGMEKRLEESEFGNALVFVSDILAFIPRHGIDEKNKIPPHMINHQANMAALKKIGVGEIIGINSTGSLKIEVEPGMMVIPDDYMCLSGVPTIFKEEPVHITPNLDHGIRKRLIQASNRLGVVVKGGGVYWQTSGPRLETRAEIKLMSTFADIVGMTMASEATVAQELGLSYAAICSVDNYGHGIGTKKLSSELIAEAARRNSKNIMEIIKVYIEEFSKNGKRV